MMKTGFADRFFDKHVAVRRNHEYPTRLYRYRSCSTPYFAEELCRLFKQNELFFPNQPYLNDPDDCQPVLEKGVTFAEFRKFLHPMICAIRTEMYREVNHIWMGEPEYRKHIRDNIKSESWEIQRAYYDSRLNNMLTEAMQNTCVLSLTKENNNTVMWSMYGGRGNGVCVEFADLCMKIERRLPYTDDKIGPLQVHYVNTRPIFNYNSAFAMFLEMTMNAANYIPTRCHRRMLEGLEQVAYAWTKHERWSYEEEFRLIMQRGFPYKENRVGEYIKIGERCFSGIYLGDAVSDEVVEKSISLARTHVWPLRVYRGHKSNTSFGLNFELIYAP